MTIATDIILQAVDTDDQTVLFDFNDATGASNPFSVRTWTALDGSLAIGAPEMESIQFWPDVMDGGRTMRARERLRTVAWSQRILGADYDSLVGAVGELTQILRRGGTLRWQAKGSAEQRWIDFVPSEAPPFFTGQSFSMQQLINEFDTAQGVPIALSCQPYLRGPLLTSATNYLSNATMLRVSLVTSNRPRSWTWDSTTGLSDELIDPANEAYQFILATTGTRNLEQTTAAASAAPGDVWTLSVFVRQVEGDPVGQCRMVGRYLDNTSTPVAAEETGTLTPLTSAWQRLSLTMSAAPASTDRVKVTVRFANSDVDPATIQLRFAQAERGTLSPFVTSLANMGNDAKDLTRGGGIPIYIHGNAWAPVALTVRSPDSSAQVEEYLVGRRSQNGEALVKQVVGYLNGTTSQCESGTLSNSSTAVSDADGSGSGNNVVEVDYDTESEDTLFKKRVRLGFFVEPESMRGTWDVWLRCRATGAGLHEIQLRWSASFATPVPNTNKTAVLDTSQSSSFTFAWLYLGSIAVPYDYATLQGVACELWSRRVSGAGDLRLDFIAYAPIDDPEPSLTRIIAPARSEESWVGSELVTPPAEVGADPTLLAGDVINDNLRMNLANEACGTPPNTGQPWDVGLHRITFHIQPTADNALRPAYRIVNITDDNETVLKDPGVSLIGDITEDVVIEAPTVAGKSYQAQAWVKARTKGSLRIDSITHETIPFLGQQAGVYTDPETGMVAKVDSSDNFQTRLESKGPIPVWCPPGLSVLYVHAVDVPTLGMEVGQAVLGRTWTVGVTYAPRYWA